MYQENAGPGFGPRAKKKFGPPSKGGTAKKSLHQIGKTDCRLQSDIGLGLKRQFVLSTNNVLPRKTKTRAK